MLPGGVRVVVGRRTRRGVVVLRGMGVGLGVVLLLLLRRGRGRWGRGVWGVEGEGCVLGGEW